MPKELEKLREEWHQFTEDDTKNPDGLSFVILEEDEKTIANFWLKKIQERDKLLVERIEGLKGWENCIKGKETHGKCPACAERKGINKTVDDVVSIINNIEPK